MPSYDTALVGGEELRMPGFDIALVGWGGAYNV